MQIVPLIGLLMNVLPVFFSAKTPQKHRVFINAELYFRHFEDEWKFVRHEIFPNLQFPQLS